MRNFLFLAVITFWVSCCSCNNTKSGDNKSSDRATDSTEIVKLLHTAYKWHGTEGKDIIDFAVIVKDSFQVGIDTVKVNHILYTLKRTNYFSAEFLQNYQKISRQVDYKLKHDSVKYYNEINFSFQDADPWTFFQDDFGNYWDSLKISGIAINADTASLEWQLRNQNDTDKYMVKFKRESNVWKISYLQGFDIRQVYLN
jgi:hypothetical protein